MHVRAFGHLFLKLKLFVSSDIPVGVCGLSGSRRYPGEGIPIGRLQPVRHPQRSDAGDGGGGFSLGGSTARQNGGGNSGTADEQVGCFCLNTGSGKHPLRGENQRKSVMCSRGF